MDKGEGDELIETNFIDFKRMIKTCFNSEDHRIPFFELEDGLILTSKPKMNSYLHIKQIKRANDKTLKFIKRNPKVVISKE